MFPLALSFASTDPFRSTLVAAIGFGRFMAFMALGAVIASVASAQYDQAREDRVRATYPHAVTALHTTAFTALVVAIVHIATLRPQSVGLVPHWTAPAAATAGLVVVTWSLARLRTSSARPFGGLPFAGLWGTHSAATVFVGIRAGVIVVSATDRPRNEFEFRNHSVFALSVEVAVLWLLVLTAYLLLVLYGQARPDDRS